MGATITCRGGAEHVMANLREEEIGGDLSLLHMTIGMPDY